MPHSVKRHLDVEADAYDVEIRRFIPHYDDMRATGVELLAALASPAAHVLDLGGGTGALSAAVLLAHSPEHLERRGIPPALGGEVASEAEAVRPLPQLQVRQL